MLTPTHEFNRAVGIPRSAAIEYPYGRPVGEVGDRDGQRRVLQAALAVLAEAGGPVRSATSRSPGRRRPNTRSGSRRR